MDSERQVLAMQYTSENEFMVAIEMITYNHEKYIAQAIESVLMQKTNFNYKLIICEDCSTDNTAQICLKYKEKYPDKIDLHLNEKNLGVYLNAKKLHELSFTSNAKYIAMLDGDDYWCDENKLEKQVSFLEKNTAYSLCFHAVYEQSGDLKKPSDHNISNKEETFDCVQLARYNFISTPTVVFRNGLFENLPRWFFSSPAGDYVLHMLNSRRGPIKYFPDLMAVYRKHTGGIWSPQTQKTSSEKWIRLLDNLITEDFSPEVIHELKSQRRYTINGYLKFFLEEGNEKEFLHKMEEFSNSDSLIKEEWLNTYYLKYINELKQGKAYRLAQKLASLKNLVMKGTSN
jgi:glycosyltransferase involved in cell wall biosynthesis